VLILGDSISIGYTPMVREALVGQAVVLRPMTADGKAENCSGTTHGLRHLDRWLALEGGHWDVIHLNWGLHDLKHQDAKGQPSSSESDPPQATVEVYERQLRELVSRLQSTGAALVFATTTPVPDGKLSPWRSDEDVVKYNEAALRVMRQHGVAVNDLYGFCKPRLQELQLPANVHFKPEGSKALAGEVARSIQEALRKAGKPAGAPASSAR
jgi:acyl-CoA thioesterase-1